MSKYINEDKFISYIDAGKYHSKIAPFFSEDDVLDMIDRQNKIDIVFCKDCKHYIKPYCGRFMIGLTPADDDAFCAWGERRETE